MRRSRKPIRLSMVEGFDIMLSKTMYRVRGKGCSGCIELVKIHLFKHPAVHGVCIRGYYVVVVHDPRVDPDDILHETRVLDYYVFERIDGSIHVDELCREHPLSMKLGGSGK